MNSQHLFSDKALQHWKMSTHENFSRMRLKLIVNEQFDSHADASSARDNSEQPLIPCE